MDEKKALRGIIIVHTKQGKKIFFRPTPINDALKKLSALQGVKFAYPAKNSDIAVFVTGDKVTIESLLKKIKDFPNVETVTPKIEVTA